MAPKDRGAVAQRSETAEARVVATPDRFSVDRYAGSSKALRFAGELTIVNLRDPDSTSVGTWTEADEYLMIVDNNSGSFAPLLPSAGLDVCLHCNLPDVPGRFRLGECSNGRLGLCDCCDSDDRVL